MNISTTDQSLKSEPGSGGKDPITTEIIRNAFEAVTTEMKLTLMRTAYNMIIYEALDFTVGLFTAKGETVSIGLGLPMFIRGLSETVKAKLAKLGPENLEPGDVLLTNDAYITGSHLNHMTFSLPIYYDGKLVAFAACMAHWPDIGGTLDGMTTDIFSEGLQLPILKYHRAGQVNEEIEEIIGMNVRLPERAMGDLRAQLAAIKVGERRIVELMDRYGTETVLASIDSLMDQSEAAAREMVLNIPDGTYQAESFMDDDGVSIGKRIPIRVRVLVAGDEMTVDLSDVSEQVQGFYNSGETAGRSCVQVAFKCLTSPRDYPINDGAFRPLNIILPMGRVVSAVKPAPMRWWMTFPMTVIDTIFKALEPAIPDRVIAGHHADLLAVNVNGFGPDDGKLFIYVGGLLGGGWGAKQTEDGVSATIPINDGDTHNGPSEQVEVKYPLLVERYGLRDNSGDPGLHRGGLGCEQVVRALDDITFNAQVDRVHCTPWGLDGGRHGAGNQVRLRRVGEEETSFTNGKVLTARLKKGDAYVLRSGGGGGFGNPLDRDPELVQQDVRQGYVTADAAERFYGVVLAPSTLEIDDRATAEQRHKLAAAPAQD